MCRKGSVIADVENFFSVTSDITKKIVEEALKNATESGNSVLKGAQVTGMSLCIPPIIPVISCILLFVRVWLCSKSQIF